MTATPEKGLGIHREGDGVTLTLDGRLGLGNVEELHRSALEAQRADADVRVVDVAAVTHVDTAAAQVLLALRSAVTSSGHSFEINNASDDLAPLLTWTGLAASGAA